MLVRVISIDPADPSITIYRHVDAFGNNIFSSGRASIFGSLGIQFLSENVIAALKSVRATVVVGLQ